MKATAVSRYWALEVAMRNIAWSPTCGTESRCLFCHPAIFMGFAVALLVATGFTGKVLAQQGPAPGVVKVMAQGEGDRAQREGSGFVVGFEPGLTFIATAAHVIEGDPHPRIVFAATPHLTL